MSAKMRISLFVPTLHGGGTERVMLDLAKGFLAREYAVELVLVRAAGDLVNDIPDGCQVVDLDCRRAPVALSALIRHLARSNPDVLLATLPQAVATAIIAKKVLGGRIKVVARIANTMSEEMARAQRRSVLRSYGFRVARATLPFSDGIVAVSDGVADDLKQHHLPERALHLVRRIYNPVVSPEQDELAKQPPVYTWGSEGCNTPLILAAGRLTDVKDHATLLRAFAHVARNRDCHLMILGEGPERDNLRALAVDLGIDSRVTMPGFVPNPFTYMERASVVVQSSRYEGFPNVLVQAMSRGTSVVSTDCPSGPREILMDSAFGSLVPIGDDVSMAQAIERTLNERSPSDTLKLRAADFAADRSVEQYLTLLTSVAAS